MATITAHWLHPAHNLTLWALAPTKNRLKILVQYSKKVYKWKRDELKKKKVCTFLSILTLISHWIGFCTQPRFLQMLITQKMQLIPTKVFYTIQQHVLLWVPTHFLQKQHRVLIPSFSNLMYLVTQYRSLKQCNFVSFSEKEAHMNIWVPALGALLT